MTLNDIFIYCFIVTIIGLMLAIFTVLFNRFGKPIHSSQDGREILSVASGNFKIYVDTLQLTTIVSLSLIIIPLFFVFYLFKEKAGPPNPAELCKKYEGEYSLATQYYFIDNLHDKGIRAKVAKDGTSWQAVCKPEKDGGYLLVGRDKTVHFLEVKLKDSTKNIHARKFESEYDSKVFINKDGKFEWRRIVSNTGTIKPLINDSEDFTKNKELEGDEEEKEHIENQIKKYLAELKKDREDLADNNCYITTGKDRGVAIVGFTCLNRYTRMMRRNP